MIIFTFSVKKLFIIEFSIFWHLKKSFFLRVTQKKKCSFVPVDILGIIIIVGFMSF